MKSFSGDILDRVLVQLSRAGAHSGDAILSLSESTETRVRSNEIDYVKQARERKLGIRAFVRSDDGLRCAVTSTSDLSETAISKITSETVELARATGSDPYAGLPTEDFVSEVVDLGLITPKDREIDVDTHIKDAKEAERAARETDTCITNSEGSESSSGFGLTIYKNSEGFSGEYETGTHGIFSMPVAMKNGEMQTDFWGSISRHRAQLEDPSSVGRHAAIRALRRLGSVRIPTCEAAVIFEPVTARSLIGHLASCVTGSSIYRKTSYLAERFGDRIASNLVTILDDGRRISGLASRPFDGEGLPTRCTEVVKQGRLTSFLLDTYSSRKLNLASTGSCNRAPGNHPGPGISNLWLEPGTNSLEQIVANTESGLLVTWLFGHGFNSVTGDFSRGAAGMWIENGELAFPVHEITVAGNLLQMFEDIDFVGNDLLWQGPIASPSIRIAKMSVAGE